MITSAYIHIPFCHQICHYCDFTKFFYNPELADQYLEALENEIVTAVGKQKKPMKTIFVGGGTPTALSYEQLERLLKMIAESFDVDAPLEYTFEANPGEFDEKKLALLKEYGVNRISFGVQVFDDELLEKLGRNHRVQDVYDSLRLFEKQQFDNVSVDLMYGLPGQTYDQFKKTIDEALQLGLPHYSSYSLQIEPKTVFYLRHKKGKLHKPVEEEEANMYELLMSEMNKSGVYQYEISNFAKPGYESKHNLTYWNNDYYYGFGAGAHGYLPGERTVNIKPLNQYTKKAKETGVPQLYVEPVHHKEEMEEQMFLGLRKVKGVSLDEFQRRFGRSIHSLYSGELDYLKRKNWITEAEDHIALTPQGRLFGNEVFAQFLIEDEKLQ
ncbi:MULTISPECIES: radical SAM family heme chaperone HemW [Pontibacillus]|uniref:Heme chaperone HemW n=1 Tax=Pontibacillus chungwhensis TaxID=265426 RepID=A0ABY8V3K7_9BACI|nr:MULTISPECIES: radical SAM family heme chaperone HemW [Pontibacillus]MCD5323631.1 radical SAM family heme chaperone HemW [Pontibacillus sp. HN14]WIG00221.1 radical SAM family heme chaperone HemW [Pontibacillus chungwhensis]